MHEIGDKTVLICTRPEKLAPTGPHSWRCLLYSGILVRCQLWRGLIVTVFRNIRSREELNIFVLPNRLCTLSIADCLYSGIQDGWLIYISSWSILKMSSYVLSLYSFLSVTWRRSTLSDHCGSMQSPSIKSQVFRNNNFHIYLLITNRSLHSNPSIL